MKKGSVYSAFRHQSKVWNT